MEILNAQSGYSISSPNVSKTNTENSVVNQQGFSRVYYNEDTLEQESNQKKKTRFDVDQQAIQLVEQDNANKANQQQAKHTGYDQPSEQNYTAISAYQSIENQSQRDNIQQVFGVDLLA